MDYKKAGVDIEAGYKAVSLMKEHIASTMIPEVLTDIGGFSGAFSMKKFVGMEEPTLVSGTDGVGTKLKIAFLLDKHNTIGIDCVAMCVNDIVCQGAKPLLFLDYIAQGKLIPQRVAEIVKGVSKGCVESGCALIGGETAEMPGFYPADEYDLAGFSVGLVDQERIIDGKKLAQGDALIGLASSGVHSNGFSLVRKVFDIEKADLTAPMTELEGKSLGEVLLAPTKIYVKSVLALIDGGVDLHGASHVTGGGFYENVPRMLPEGCAASIDGKALPQLPIFRLIQEKGKISDHDMYNTFNMGVGMTVCVDPADVEKTIEILKANGEEAYVIGQLVESSEGVIIE